MHDRLNKPSSRYHRFKREKEHESLLKGLEKIILNDKNSTNKQQHWIISFSSVISNLSQFAMLLIIGFGYYYTVLPIFQKELISEENARLTIDKNKLIKQIDSLRKDKSMMEQDSIAIEKNLTTLQNEKLLAARKLEKTRKKYSKVKKQILTVEDTLQKAKKKLYDELRLTITGQRPMSLEFITFINASLSLANFNRNSKNQVALNLKNNFILPSEVAKQKIKEIKNKLSMSNLDLEKEMLIRLLKEYENGLIKQKNLLKCEIPIFKLWQSSFIDALEVNTSILDMCIKTQYDDLIKFNKWNKQEIKDIKKTNFWKDTRHNFKISCVNQIDREIESFYTKKWQFTSQPCRERLQNISLIILDEIDSSKIMPLRSTTPPLKIEINEMLKKYYVNTPL